MESTRNKDRDRDRRRDGDGNKKRDRSRERDRERDGDKDKDRDGRHHHRQSHRDRDGDSHRSRRHRTRSSSPSHRSSRDHNRERERGHRSSRHQKQQQEQSSSRRFSQSPSPSPQILLPENAKPLDHRTAVRPYFKLFAKYLDIQKSTDIADLTGDEAKDRFMRFVRRWNRGELASGWYGSEIKASTDVDESYPTYTEYSDYISEQQAAAQLADSQQESSSSSSKRKRDEYGRDRRGNRDREVEDMDDEELEAELNKFKNARGTEDTRMDDAGDSDSSSVIGPELPGGESLSSKARGAKAPNRQDLDLQQELNDEEMEEMREDLRYARKQQRKREKERLEELVPRAEAGTRERQLEKKKEKASSNRAFADAKAGDVAEIPEDTLMGGEESFKQKKASMDRKKNERELRREALNRARREERQERLEVHKQKEENTMKMLKALAEKFKT